MVGIDRLDERSELGMPLGDCLRCAFRRSRKSGEAARVLNQLPGEDSRRVGITADNGLDPVLI